MRQLPGGRMARQISPSAVPGDVESDEALARRLQAEEAAASGQGTVSEEPHGLGSVSGQAEVRESDEDFARILQRHLEESSDRGQGDTEMSDEELARLLQEQEDTQARRGRGRSPAGQESEGPRFFPPSRDLPAHLLGVLSGLAPPGVGSPSSSRHGGSSSGCWPFFGSVVSSGAFFGCCAGLQIASMLGCGQTATWLCSLGGAVSGHVASNDPQPFRAQFASHVDDESDYDSEEEDDYQRGLDHEVIEGHTIGHKFNAGAETAPPKGSDEDNSKCMVCMEHFEQGEALRSLPCLHRYHQSCIDEWLMRSPECPICKHDITVMPQPLQTSDQSNGSNFGSRLFRGRPWRRRS
mmetsp:Transcript_42459/g.76295  ORF Transcript_42459/g.76295 Transcript_42459/m.76295 type:complete len:352 (+) Transcript_42459:103-1158(+)